MQLLLVNASVVVKFLSLSCTVGFIIQFGPKNETALVCPTAATIQDK